jgi:hypothetical protein
MFAWIETATQILVVTLPALRPLLGVIQRKAQLVYSRSQTFRGSKGTMGSGCETKRLNTNVSTKEASIHDGTGKLDRVESHHTFEIASTCMGECGASTY